MTTYEPLYLKLLRQYRPPTQTKEEILEEIILEIEKRKVEEKKETTNLKIK